MEIYKNFTRQTDFVVAYLSTARSVEHQTRVEVPKLKHAPVNLGKQLEDYLMDPDFEINRRQYLAEQESKKGRGGANGASKPFASSSKSESESRAATAKAFPDPTPAPAVPPVQPPKGPAPDLIDFFESIEQNQQPMAAQPQLQQGYPQFNNGVPFQAQQQQQPQQQQIPLQQSGFPQQQDFQNPAQFQQQPFHTGMGQPQMQQPQQIQQSFTGAGFGGYTPQPSFQPGNLSSIPQDATANFQPTQQMQPQQQQLSPLQQQTTNPFRISMMTNTTGMGGPAFASPPAVASPIAAKSTNPFAKSATPPTSQPFSPPIEQQFQQQQQQQQQQPAPLRSMATGTNPFAKNIAQRPQTSAGLMPQPTGSTNPFRQSQFVNTATGQGWQNNQQPMGGGLDNLETIPVFPRPTNQQPWQQ